MTDSDPERRPEISASSPDGRIWADTTNGKDLRVSFSYGVFDQYADAILAHQLGRLGQAVWIAFQRSQDDLHERQLASFRVAPIPGGPPERTPSQAAYLEALNEVVGFGTSPDGAITVRTTGALYWDVDFPDGTVARLGEHAFVSQLTAAVREMLADREKKISGLKAEFLDLGVPRSWTELLNQLRSRNRAQE